MGQLVMVLRAKYLVDAQGYNKIQGQAVQAVGNRSARSKRCWPRIRPYRPKMLTADQEGGENMTTASLPPLH